MRQSIPSMAGIIAFLIVTLLLFVGVAAAAADAPAAPAANAPATAPSEQVSPAEQVQFHQRNAAAQFQELEERMFRLAELTRETEPDDSARLLMGFQRAREELIAEQMKTIIAMIGEQDLARAADQQKNVLLKLEELKRLLTTGDMDLKLKLEQLRKLQAAIEKLDRAIKDEKRQVDQTSKLSASKQPQPGDLTKAQQDQVETRKTTSALSQAVREFGDAGARAGQGLGGACQSMSAAEGSLAAQKPGEAEKQQNQALQAMQKARDELERERQRMLAEIERQVRKQVMENLTHMLETQQAVREATQMLSPRLASNERQAELRVRQLGATEQKIADMAEATIELIDQTGFSLALPPALASIQRGAQGVAVDLRAGRGGEPVIAAELRVEQEIKDLLEAMKDSASSSQSSPSQCKSCNGNKNKLLAELKVIRMLQMRVNAQTKDVDARRGMASTDQADAIKGEIAEVAHLQKDVRDATDKLHHSICPHCLAEE